MEQEIVNIFVSLAHEHEKCVIVVTHSTEIALQSDVILQLHEGNLMEIDKKTLMNEKKRG